MVREQLARLAGIERDVVVERCPATRTASAGAPGCSYAVDAGGQAGLRRHRSHDVVPIDWCRIAHPLVVDGAGAATNGGRPDERGRGRRPRSATGDAAGARRRRAPAVPRGRAACRTPSHEVAAGRAFRVSGGGFWQVHPGAAEALLERCSRAWTRSAGDRRLDLYCGVGLFAAALAERVGPAAG